MSSTDFAEMSFKTIGFKDKWLSLIGDPAPGFTAMVFGKPKMGKSYLCVDFAGYLARNHGKILYVAKEEGLDATLQQKLKDKDVAHPNLYVADQLPENFKGFQFVILDSVNKLKLLPEDLERLKKENPGVSFVYIFQSTKEGKFRGTNEFQHDVDIVIEVPERGRAVQFGRFNQGGEMAIFPDTQSLSGIDLRVPEGVSMLAGIKKSPMKKEKYPAWTTPEHLSPKDHADLWMVNKLYKEGKFEAAIRFASGLDTAVREEIPGDIWLKLGGKLTKTGEEKLKASKKSKKPHPENVLDKFEGRNDDLNPRYIFSLTASQLLSEGIKGEFDVLYLMRRELANRGQDENGKWVGFEKAAQLHKLK